MRHGKRLLASLALLLVLVPGAAAQTIPYENYNYSEMTGALMTAPQAYVPERVFDAAKQGFLAEPTDIHTDAAGHIYLLDGGSGRILVYDADWNSLRVIDGFTREGKAESFEGARGIFVDDRYIYIADTENHRIVILEQDGKLVEVSGAPQSTMLGKDFVFKPIRVATDPDRLLYVVGEGTFEGVITMEWDGTFTGFVGANNVKPSAWDIFWMQFSTVEQRQKMVQFVPQDFSSIDVDDDGFFYCTTQTKQKSNGKEHMVKRLNPGGSDVIRSLSRTALVGDPKEVSKGSMKGLSKFTDVAYKDYGIYACLDYVRGRVFVYNHDGYLLYSFGTLSAQDGGFKQPSAVCWLPDDRVAVVDTGRCSVTVFRPTKYADAIHAGLAAQEELRHDDAYRQWQTVLTYNAHFQLAHIQTGKVHLNKGEFRQAMDEFTQGGSKSLYSKAFAKYRIEWIYSNIRWILAGMLALAAGIAVLVFVVKRRHRRRTHA